MKDFLLFIYILILFSSFYSKNLYVIASVVIVGLLYALIYPIYIRNKVNAFKKEINENINSNSPKPLIDINKAPWYLIQNLPGFNAASAKKAVQIRTKQGNYISIEDFCLRNSLQQKNIELVKKVIYM